MNEKYHQPARDLSELLDEDIPPVVKDVEIEVEIKRDIAAVQKDLLHTAYLKWSYPIVSIIHFMGGTYCIEDAIKDGGLQSGIVLYVSATTFAILARRNHLKIRELKKELSDLESKTK